MFGDWPLDEVVNRIREGIKELEDRRVSATGYRLHTALSLRPSICRHLVCGAFSPWGAPAAAAACCW